MIDASTPPPRDQAREITQQASSKSPGWSMGRFLTDLAVIAPISVVLVAAAFAVRGHVEDWGSLLIIFGVSLLSAFGYFLARGFARSMLVVRAVICGVTIGAALFAVFLAIISAFIGQAV